MLARIAMAAARGLLVAVLIAVPSIVLTHQAGTNPEVVVFLSLLGAVLIFAEYNSNAPSFLEFRDAPPLNRSRFLALFAILFGTSLILRHEFIPNGLTALFYGLGLKVEWLANMPFSPAQLMVGATSGTTKTLSVEHIKSAASLSYVLSLALMIGGIAAIRVAGWPLANGAFNVWTNLPLFDPTTGGDVVARMQREGRISIAFGLVLPFAIPGGIQMISLSPLSLNFDLPLMLTWAIALWAFVPASMVLRGFAMLRIADLIAAQRRRTYAASDQLQTA